MGWLGLMTHKFDDIGVFTYWLQDDTDSVFPSNCCSIVVQRNVKVCRTLFSYNPRTYFWNMQLKNDQSD